MKSFLLVFFFFVCVVCGFGQVKKKPAGFNKGKANQADKFLDKQWWIGFKAGTNLTEAVPGTRYSITVPTNYSASRTEKVYDVFNEAGSQASLEFTFFFKGFSFSTQPTYRLSRFTYSNQLYWGNSSGQLILNYDHEQKTSYADVPLMVKYDITGNKLRPYIQAGIFYSFLINATKSVTVTGTDGTSGTLHEFSNEPVIVGARDLFHKGYWGLMGGAGLDYNIGNIRVVLDASYWKGMSNVANTQNRYSNNRLSGIGEALDDMKLNNIVISAGCLFPLRFLSNDFKSLGR
jgi:outer membrane protein W